MPAPKFLSQIYPHGEKKSIAWQHFHIINFCKKAEKHEIGENISQSKKWYNNYGTLVAITRK